VDSKFCYYRKKIIQIRKEDATISFFICEESDDKKNIDYCKNDKCIYNKSIAVGIFTVNLFMLMPKNDIDLSLDLYSA
jgi:hypothetical protein